MGEQDDGDAGAPVPPLGNPRVDEAEQVSATAEVHKNAWEGTLDDLWSFEEEFESEGWETITTAAGHTGPVAPVHDKGYWGLSHILPNSHAEAIEDVIDDREFPEYDVYRETVHGRVFAVTTYMDPDTETVILLASNFKLRDAIELVSHSHEVGHVNSVFRYLDGRVVAEVRHDEPEKFFPRYDDFGTFRDRWRNEPAVNDGE